MARYQIGEKVIVGYHEIQGRSIQSYVGNIFKPWEETLLKLHLVELTCVEHHKVAWVYEPEEKKHDGFVFEDTGGHRWYNQYPHAHYGQLSDDANWYFTLVSKEGFQGISDRLWTFEDVTITIDRISRGIKDFDKIILGEHSSCKFVKYNTQEMKDHQAMLANHRTYICKKIEKTFGATIEIKPLVLEFTNGQAPEEFPDILRASLTYKATA